MVPTFRYNVMSHVTDLQWNLVYQVKFNVVKGELTKRPNLRTKTSVDCMYICIVCIGDINWGFTFCVETQSSSEGTPLCMPLQATPSSGRPSLPFSSPGVSPIRLDLSPLDHCTSGMVDAWLSQSPITLLLNLIFVILFTT